VIAAHKDWVVKRWLQRVNSEPELIRVNLSDAERQDHIPDLLDEIVATHASIRFNWVHGTRVRFRSLEVTATRKPTPSRIP